MTKLAEHGRVEEKDGEVRILFKPEISFNSIKNLVNECSSGGCSCGCDVVLSAVDEIVTEDGADGAIVHLRGGQVKAQEVQKLFNECDHEIPIDNE